MDIRILKNSTCPSRSGKSQLTYQIGCNEHSDLYLRIHSNSGNGFFNAEWISVKQIQTQLTNCGNQFTSFALNVLFKGKSMNTPFFILAVLFKEGLVVTSTSNRRCYQLGDFDGFFKRIEPLLKSDTVFTEPSKKKLKRQDEAVLDTLLTKA